MTEYTPGVCNIDVEGQRKRRTFGIIGILLGVIVSAIIALFSISIWWMIAAFVLFWMGMLGIVQSRAKFCVANAAKGQYEAQGKMTRIEDAHAQSLDQKRARALHTKAIVYAIVLTAILVILLLQMK